MSGGFFRGTSTDQDTRFSNKKAKLLKSQKFAPELETLVDMTKVKMDVLRPWIAKRVTELIGFEDEVLINFIYGLLEGKEVNGKEVQISLTGFMERNTGKFMKELWLLLLSAQQNLSGVPQQFLDAKEEETKKKKAETDRIANEIHKKREKERQELEQEKTNMDGVGEMLSDKHAEVELNLKPDPRLSSIQSADEEEQNERKHLRGRSRVSRSPDSAYRSSSLRQKLSTPPSKSFSNSRSYSDERQRLRSISKSPPSRSRSDSSERRYSTSPRRSLTPRRRYAVQHSPSPSRRRSSHSKRRSVSHSRRRSPSPTRYRVRSPGRRRSRSPRRWSRSPIRTSPARRRSPSPMRRRSPSPVRRRSLSSMKGRSPSPVRYRSPSPVSRRSLSRRSPSPRRHPSPSPRRRPSPSPRRRPSPSPRPRRSRSPWRRRPQSLRRHSPSPVRRRYQRSPSTTQQQSMSPVHRGSSILGRKRSLTPALRRSPTQESSSCSPIRNSSLSPVRKESPKSMRFPPHSTPGERVRSHEKHSRARSASPRERAENSAKNHQGSIPVDRKPIISLRSPQRDMLDRNDSRVKEPAASLSMKKSPFVSSASRERGYSEDRRSSSPRGSLHQRREKLIQPKSPILKTAVPKPRRDTSGTSADDENFSTREARDHKYRSSGKASPTPDQRKDFTGPAKVLDEGSKARKSQLTNSEKLFDRVNHKEREQQELSVTPKTTSRSEKGKESNVDEGDRNGDKGSAQADDSKGANWVQELEVLPKLLRKSELNDRNGSMGSPSKETDEHNTKVKEKRKHKKSDRHEVESDDYSSYDSYEERKEAKRRRKEEKRLKKEERRRRRDDRRRRKEERRSEKRKLKSTNAGSPPSDLERDHSEDESYRRQESRSDNQEAKSEQKNLEIALREKALESLRAKKGIGN